MRIFRPLLTALCINDWMAEDHTHHTSKQTIVWPKETTRSIGLWEIFPNRQCGRLLATVQ